MKLIWLTLFLFSAFISKTNAQRTNLSSDIPVWSEADRKFLLDNLIRTNEEIINETKNLTQAQWNFKETEDRWSINQIIEHIAIWELLFMREISQALANEPDSLFTAYPPDSAFLSSSTKETKAANALEYTKPFSFAVPLGNNIGSSNITWFTTMRSESIEYLKKENRNIRLAYDRCSGKNVHHYYLMIFSHTDNHLKQIKKVKSHPAYPK